MNIQTTVILMLLALFHEVHAQCRVYRPTVTRCYSTPRVFSVDSPSPIVDRNTPPDVPTLDEQNSSFGKTVRLPLIKQIGTNSKWHNDCGQYVAAATLSALGEDITSAEYDRIGRSVNRDQTGVSIAALTEFLRAYVDTSTGFCDFSMLRSQIDHGLPAILAVRLPSGGGHWIMVAGYTADGEGQPIRWQVVDNGVLNGDVDHRELAEMWSDHGNEVVLVRPFEHHSKTVTERLLAQLEDAQLMPDSDVQLVQTIPEPIQPVELITKQEISNILEPETVTDTAAPIAIENAESSSSSMAATPGLESEDEAVIPGGGASHSKYSVDALLPPGSATRLVLCIALIALPTGGLMFLFFRQGSPTVVQGA